MKSTILIIFVVIFIVSNNTVLSQSGIQLEVTVEVDRTKPNGKAWDIGQGAPDVIMYLYSPEHGKIKSSVCRDTYKCTYTFSLGQIDRCEMKLEIYDKDMVQHDFIGSGKVNSYGGGLGKFGSAQVSYVTYID